MSVWTDILTCVFVILTCITILFQWALASGAPWAEYSNGGRFKPTLPTHMRPVAIIQSLILLLFIIIVIGKNGWMGDQAGWEWTKVGIWVVVAFMALAMVMNTVTPSKKERKVWAPVTIVLFSSSLALAVGSP